MKHFGELRQAYHLIKSGHADEARPIVNAILKQDQDQIDAWWLAAFTAKSLKNKQIALQHVLRLDPNHAQAQVFLEQLTQQQAKISTTNIPITPPTKEPDKPIKWTFVALMVIGTLAMLSVPMMILDNFLLGGEILNRFETALGIEKEPLGWVHAFNGGSAFESLAEEQRIPITKKETIKRGSIQTEALREGEAHQYRFNAQRGDELVIAAIFSNNNDSAVTALELWDSDGNLIATELNDQAFDLGSLLGGRALQFNVVRDDLLSVVLVSRPGGPVGNYSLIIDTLEGVLESN